MQAVGADVNGSSALRVLAITRSDAVRSQVAEALGGQGRAALESRVGALPVQAASLPRLDRFDLLVLEPDVDDPADHATLEQLRALTRNSSTGILVTAANIGPNMVRRLLREGVDDVIPQPCSPAELAEGLHAVVARRRAPPVHGRSGRVVTFTRASGGVGATTLAVNTAVALTVPTRKRRTAAAEASPRVCLLDFDLQFGSAGLQLDLPPSAGMMELVQNPERLDRDMLHGLMTGHASGLKVLAAPKAPIPLDALRPELATEMVRLARSEFDLVVVDLPQALTRWTETVLSASTDIMLVVQLNVPALRQLRRLLDMLQDEGLYALPYRIVLNRYAKPPFWRQGVGYRQAEKALGRRFDFVVGNDYRLVVDSLNQGQPLLQRNRRSRIVRDVRAMLDAMLQQAGPVARPAVGG
jgi:pilus assembly protein CpaE